MVLWSGGADFSFTLSSTGAFSQTVLTFPTLSTDVTVLGWAMALTVYPSGSLGGGATFHTVLYNSAGSATTIASAVVQDSASSGTSNHTDRGFTMSTGFALPTPGTLRIEGSLISAPVKVQGTIVAVADDPWIAGNAGALGAGGDQLVTGVESSSGSSSGTLTTAVPDGYALNSLWGLACSVVNDAGGSTTFTPGSGWADVVSREFASTALTGRNGSPVLTEAGTSSQSVAVTLAATGTLPTGITSMRGSAEVFQSGVFTGGPYAGAMQVTVFDSGGGVLAVATGTFTAPTGGVTPIVIDPFPATYDHIQAIVDFSPNPWPTGTTIQVQLDYSFGFYANNDYPGAYSAAIGEYGGDLAPTSYAYAVGYPLPTLGGWDFDDVFVTAATPANFGTIIG